MRRRSCDGRTLFAAFAAALTHFEAHVADIDALNVFPVPDGDTGSNMMATLRAAREEAEGLGAGERSAARVAAAISFGALMGARGNSGVILSQVFRGMSESLADRKRFDGLDLANALVRGRDTAYAAVAKPVEGTILTVIREASAAAVLAAARDRGMEAVLRATVESAARAVASTPSLLAILREAGVVDSGAEGLHQLLHGALLHLVGGGAATVAPRARVMAPRPAAAAAHADDGFGYETMFLVSAGERPLDLDAVRRRLEGIGESVLVAGDAQTMKIHVHNERPDEVIAIGLTLGTLSRISVENLDQQAHGVREARAGAFTGAPAGTLAPVPPVEPLAGSRAPEAAPATPVEVTTGVSVVAVAAGDGIIDLFESFQVARIVRGGQAANPSTGELLLAIRAVPGREVLILPNNANCKLAAQQAAALAPEKRVVVVPTRNGAEGLAALLALDPDKDAAANAVPMLKAARSIQTLQVTEAVRAARIGGRKVRKGQTIALDPDDGLVAVGGDRQATVVAAVGALDPGFELLTVYYGDGAAREEAETLAGALNAAHPGVEVELVPGGQPHYRYLIAAE